MDSFIPAEQIKNSKSTDITRRRYNRIASVYDQMEWFVENNVFRKWRKLLMDQVRGEKVLEIGVGTGKNIPFYPSNINISAIDLSENMLAKAVRQADNISRSVDFQLMDVESLTFPDNSFDTALATFVFCSVPDPVNGLRELGRVVKPGGDIWLLEHVRVNRPIIGTLMDLFNPLIVRMMGANINRHTVENVEIAGLKIISVTDLQGKLVRLIQATPA
jgi:ubiquinone/menaquinone biosynthesis C-methylase UbiE